jgi:tetratricopeptide (TPR) repeat protein
MQESLSSLRLALAMDYGNPNAHLVFAKSLKESGDPLTAFLICEHARTLFGEDAFLASFDIVFRGHITDVLFHARKQVLQTAINLAPKSVEPLKGLADLYAAHGEPADAANVLKRAMEIAPDDFEIVAALQLNLEAAGHKDDAETFLSNWCQDHPDAPLAWERHVKEAIDRNDDAASQLLDQAIAKFPDDGQLLLMRAQMEEQQKPGAAQADYVSAAHLSKDSASVQGATGRFFSKAQHDPARALQYYLAAFFLDPNFNDWGSVEQRVFEAANELTREKLAAMVTSHETEESLIDDPNPLVVANVVSRAWWIWGAGFVDELFPKLASDCPDVRQACIQGLENSDSDWTTKPRLDQMLTNQDPWTRAAAGSIVAATRPKTAGKQIAPLLGDSCLLVRFHAAIALLGIDAAGQAQVVEAMKKEPSEWLRNFVAVAIAQGSHWQKPEG